jgi:hypothetical protein
METCGDRDGAREKLLMAAASGSSIPQGMGRGISRSPVKKKDCCLREIASL